MAKKIALGVAGFFAAIILLVMILASTKPDRLHVERSLVMSGTPEQVLPYANDLTKFTTWIPWTELDPNQTMAYSDPPSGVGAWYTWTGNDDVGQGRMDILSSEPGKVVMKLHFIEPFESIAESSVSFEPAGDGKVEVTWAFDQDQGFGSKIMAVFVDMDAMIGADFDKGLARLATRLEQGDS